MRNVQATDLIQDRRVPSWTWIVLSAWIVANRLIPAHISVPLGVSIHPSELILAAAVVMLLVSMMAGRIMMPRGPLALSGLTVLVVFSFLPLLNATSLDASEVRTFDQGIVVTYLYAALVVMAYQCGRSAVHSRRVLIATIAAGAFQAIIAIIEGVTRAAFLPIHTVWQAIGLEFDPRAAGGAVGIGVNTRLTGELRVYSTAPHPLVLSALMAAGALITARFMFAVEDRRARLIIGVALAAQLLGLAFANSRTGMLVAAGCAPFLIASLVRRPLRLIALAGAGALMVLLIAVLSPSTLRLALDTATFVERDHNVEVRVERIPLILDYLSERPLLGAGYLTNDATVRQLWDNAYLNALSELAMVGFGCLLAFFITWAVTGYRVGSASELDTTLRLGAAVGGAGLLLAGLTLDAWSFDQFLPLMLVLMALAAGRVAAPDVSAIPSDRLAKSKVGR